MALKKLCCFMIEEVLFLFLIKNQALIEKHEEGKTKTSEIKEAQQLTIQKGVSIQNNKVYQKITKKRKEKKNLGHHNSNKSIKLSTRLSSMSPLGSI